MLYLTQHLKLRAFLWLICCVALFITLPFSTHAQILAHLKKSGSSNHIELRNFADSVALNSYLETWRLDQIRDGFLEAGVDSMKQLRDTTFCYLFSGPQYKWIDLEAGNVPQELLSESGYNEKFFLHKPFHPEAYSRLLRKILSSLENNGYPFAKIKLDSSKISDHGITGKLNLNRGPKIIIDSLIVKGHVEIAKGYLYQYLKIKPGDLYRETSVERIDRLMRALPFANPAQPTALLFYSDKADIYLYLNKRKASSFNGVLGLLPDPTTNKLNLTGTVKLNLMNSLKHGESIFVNWQKLEASSQQLNANLAYPFLFNTPIGISGKISLYRQDTLFTQNQLQLSFNYYLGANSEFGVFLKSVKSGGIGNLTSTNPLSSNSNSSLYGLSLKLEDLDYKFNPRAGTSLQLSGDAGSKSIIPSSSYADSTGNKPAVKERVAQYDINLDGSHFFPLGKRSTIQAQIIGGWMISNRILPTEVYRIGGLQDLRGFNDQSLMATGYGIITAEYRYLLDENSNLFVFGSRSYLENHSTTENYLDHPMSFGTGISFETKAGIFSLTYALGKQDGQQFQFKSAKIHFGYTSLF